MSVTDLTEEIVAALRDRLEAELPAAISEINAEEGHSAYPLDDPAFVLEYVPLPEELTGFPIVGIQDGRELLEDDLGHSATGIYEFTIVVVHANPVQEGLAPQLRGYKRAVKTVALRGRSIGDGWGVTYRGSVPGPTLGEYPDDDPGQGPQSYLSWVAVSIRVRCDE